MQLDPAVTVFSIPLDTSEQHETQTSLSGSCTIWSQKKNPPGNHKKRPFLASHRSDLSPSSRVCDHLMYVWRRGYRSNETGGAGAVRNGPLFANSLSAALEMRDAYRSFQLEPFVSNRKKLRASALTKCSLVLLKTNTCLNFNQVSDTHALAAPFQRWRQRSLSGLTSGK